MSNNPSSDKSSKKLLDILDSWSFWIALGLTALLSYLYFEISELQPADDTNIMRELGLSLTSNLIPVFLLFSLSYLLLRQLQLVRANDDRDALVKQLKQEIHYLTEELEKNVVTGLSKGITTIEEQNKHIIGNLGFEVPVYKVDKEDALAMKTILTAYPQAIKSPYLLLSKIARGNLRSCAVQLSQIIRGEAAIRETEEGSFTNSGIGETTAIYSVVFGSLRYWTDGFGIQFSQKLCAQPIKRQTKVVRIWAMYKDEIKKCRQLIEDEHKAKIEVKVAILDHVKLSLESEFLIAENRSDKYVVVTSPFTGNYERFETIYTNSEKVESYVRIFNEVYDNNRLLNAEDFFKRY